MDTLVFERLGEFRLLYRYKQAAPASGDLNNNSHTACH